jgi:hypothetical protein
VSDAPALTRDTIVELAEIRLILARLEKLMVKIALSLGIAQ